MSTAEPEDERSESDRPAQASPRVLSRRWILLAVLVAAAVVSASVAYVLFWADTSPQALFTSRSTELHLSVDASNSSDPGGDAIVLYAWDWGDGTNPTSVPAATASHDFALPGTYTVTLTVSDARGKAGVGSRSVTLIVLPTAFFIARQSGMTAAFDASGSSVGPGRTIASYAWEFGDGSTDVGASVTHAYTAPGRYDASLTVTDSDGRSGTTSRFVSANATTVDILADQFFVSGCPYGGFWDLRYRQYGDVLIQDHNPCLDFYPWVLYQSTPAVNPSWIYSLDRVDARVTNHLGYSLWQPVFLPVFNYSAPPAAGSFIRFNWTLDYLSSASIAYWDTTPWPVSPKYSDGFGYVVRENVTLDLQESRRIFGVVASTPAEAQAWWYANTQPAAAAGPLETRYGNWLAQLGNGKYDIYNAFQWTYESDIADLNATVAPDGTTTVSMFLDGWGFDTLMARWFYWGNVSYVDAVNAPYGQYEPRGWMPYETCWCENASVSGDIARGLNLSFKATSEYWWMATGNPGPDGSYGTADDLAGWSFAPSLMDYTPPSTSSLPGASLYPNSELQWYVPYTQRIVSPGSYGYGQQFEYMIVPNHWNMSLGNTLTLVLPRQAIPWVDPVRSYWDPAAGIIRPTTFEAQLTLRTVRPGSGYWTWDDRGKVLSIAAPAGFAWANATSLPRDPAPYVEFAPAPAST